MCRMVVVSISIIRSYYFAAVHSLVIFPSEQGNSILSYKKCLCLSTSEYELFGTYIWVLYFVKYASFVR